MAVYVSVFRSLSAARTLAVTAATELLLVSQGQSSRKTPVTCSVLSDGK
jgi:hypothetical protein